MTNEEYQTRIGKLAAIASSELLAQTEAQYKAVAHMAKALAEVHEGVLKVLPKESRMFLEMACERSARIMEQLGEIHNEMDTVMPEDKFLQPIFEKAHEILG